MKKVETIAGIFNEKGGKPWVVRGIKKFFITRAKTHLGVFLRHCLRETKGEKSGLAWLNGMSQKQGKRAHIQE